MFNDGDSGPSVGLPVVDDVFLDLKAVSMLVPDKIVTDARAVDLHESVIPTFDNRLSELVKDHIMATIFLIVQAHQVCGERALGVSHTVNQLPWEVILISQMSQIIEN